MCPLGIYPLVPSDSCFSFVLVTLGLKNPPLTTTQYNNETTTNRQHHPAHGYQPSTSGGRNGLTTDHPFNEGGLRFGDGYTNHWDGGMHGPSDRAQPAPAQGPRPLEPNRLTALGGTTLGPTANNRPGNPNGTPARDYLKVATLNIHRRTSTARGFRQEKWFKIPGLMNTHRIAILGVQEAHLTEELATGVSSVFETRLKLFHSPLPESSNAAGVAIVVNKGLVNTDAITSETLIPGRALMVTVEQADLF